MILCDKRTHVQINRDASIECYRVGLMFGIVVLHAMTQCGVCHRGLDNVLSTCVDSFVFISGYYGIKFSWFKVIRLVAVGLYCATIVAVLSGCGVHGIIPILARNDCYWFLWTYIACMMCSPIVNAGVDMLVRSCGLRGVVPCVALVFGWSYLTIVPHVKEYIPIVNGFGSIGLVSMLGTYIAARVYRLAIEKRIDKPPILCAISAACLPLIVIGFYHHNSPFTIAFVACVFSLVKRGRVPSAGMRLFSFIVPSLFSVYLLHANAWGFGVMKRLLVFLADYISVPVYISYLLVALVMTFVCFCVDLLRRMFLYCGRWCLKERCSRL